jgi:hypothetical protein
MPDNSSNAPYTTSSEMEFINNFGMHSSLHAVGRFELLKRYKNACDKRFHWAGIDYSVTMAHLDQLTRD